MAKLNYRVGIGHDTHRLEPGGPLRIGGKDIPFEFQMVGHSDADVLLHAITDAILGAIGRGDIGELFPDTDKSNKNRDSADFLMAAVSEMHAARYQVANLDCIVFAERPKLSPYKESIAAGIAEILSIPVACVNVKAKTGEHVGPVGRGEAIMAECVILVKTDAS